MKIKLLKKIFQIYYKESNGDLKVASTSTASRMLSYLKVQNNTLIIKNAPKVTKDFKIVRSGDAEWRFSGIPVADIPFKYKPTDGNTRWAKLSY